jgi:hypothetical protein
MRTFLTRARLSVVALAVAAIAALGALSGCGASNAIDPVAKAADASAAAPGYRMAFSMQVSSGALPSAVSVTGTGSFDPPAHAGSFGLTMALPNTPAVNQVFGSGGLQIREVLKGTTVYVQLPPALTSRIAGAQGKSWIKVDMSELPGKQGSALGSLASNPVSSDPSQLLQYLRGSGGMTKVGTAQVTGRSTTHYRGHVDLSQAVARVPAANRKAVQNAINTLESEGFAKQIPVDVWVDGQGLVRQMQMHMSGKPQGQTVAATIQVTIPQYGPQRAPNVPPASQILDLSGGAVL